jgi:hypothetical protein
MDTENTEINVKKMRSLATKKFLLIFFPLAWVLLLLYSFHLAAMIKF